MRVLQESGQFGVQSPFYEGGQGEGLEERHLQIPEVRTRIKNRDVQNL